MSKKLTTQISVRVSNKTLHKLNQMVEKYSAMNKREFTRSELINMAIDQYVHNHYCVLRKPKAKEVVNE